MTPGAVSAEVASSRVNNRSLFARAAPCWAALLTALACAACAPVAVQPERTSLAPTVTLPISMAGVADARQAFAALFDDELRARGGADAGHDNAWLHGVSPRVGDHADQLSALRRAYGERAASTSVLLVPGMFGDCVDTQSVPFGDGLTRTRERSAIDAYGQYADLGLLGIRLILLPGRASSAANGAVLARAIRDELARPGVQRIVLVGYSKGIADALHALAQLQADGGVPSAVKALVSVSGAVMGTPLAEQFERWYEIASPLVQPFDCSPSDGHDLASLTRRERLAWLVANPLPARLHYYSITAYAARDEIAPPLRPFHDRLSAVDARNDGQLLASDAILPGSVLLAEARADHWDVALPRDRHPNPFMRSLTSGRAYPREALFSAMLKWVIASGD
jgi:hypothetical protein